MFDPKEPARGYELLWPHDLFRAELAAILSSPVKTRDALELLLDEAMRGPDPIEDLRELPQNWSRHDPWAEPSAGSGPAHEFGETLLNNVDKLVPYRRKRYFIDRHSPDPGPLGPPERGRADLMQLQRAWEAIVLELIKKGYLDRLAGDSCQDGRDNEQPQRISELISKEIGMDDQWPLIFDGEPYAPEHFFTLVEVFHDLVARPRTRSWHDYDEHYWYYDFNDRAGQAVYRWKVNDLFEKYEIDLELADVGEDRGILVHRQLDPRQDLIRMAPTAADVDHNHDRVQHAVALFRNRNADIESKRSAIITLYAVLENRRDLVKAELLSKDERDLYEIANRFRIRHHKADQRGDYDEAYLDWLFWWYLATIELTNRLIEKSSGGHG